MDVSGIVSAVTSHAKATGLFQGVNGHEPKAAPQNGLTCAVWADSVGPVPGASGLQVTTAYVVLSVRLYTSMVQQPYDSIDPKLMDAVDKLLTAYSGDFQLGGKVRNVDLLGMFGSELSAQAGYINQDSKIYRVMTITLPLVVNDTWNQAA